MTIQFIFIIDRLLKLSMGGLKQISTITHKEDVSGENSRLQNGVPTLQQRNGVW